ncbi:EthD domain-containing protein [Lasiosphaeria miniovina]|uniref:EthD domain-containing protein n=1 Tax=Lasiosphaeria miniovina TaxID=1954250 RepID=A0AA40AMA6_9PEZI|nr:EthD domain-containing protein [Lasiosphaeria miniovina]KAK0718471.1 EthD domain-containing protein [Lasiosphaeria miniovina]
MASNGQSRRLFSITIFGYKKDDMDETEYHDYISNVHAGHLKALLAKNDIVSYTMQHNTTAERELLRKIRSDIPAEKESDADAIVQIVFKDIEDYLRARKDPHFVQVVDPDHVNFAHPKKTKFVTGWYEVHITDSQVVS